MGIPTGQCAAEGGSAQRRSREYDVLSDLLFDCLASVMNCTAHPSSPLCPPLIPATHATYGSNPKHRGCGTALTTALITGAGGGRHTPRDTRAVSRGRSRFRTRVLARYIHRRWYLVEAEGIRLVFLLELDRLGARRRRGARIDAGEIAAGGSASQRSGSGAPEERRGALWGNVRIVLCACVHVRRRGVCEAAAVGGGFSLTDRAGFVRLSASASNSRSSSATFPGLQWHNETAYNEKAYDAQHDAW
jgi:hypothetical protein